MTTRSEPLAAPRSAATEPPRRPGGTAALPWIALAALCVVALTVVIRAGRGLSFYGDEWEFLLHRRGISPRTFLAPHGDHPSVGPVALYKLLLQLVGLRAYLPYQLAVAALHLATGVALYLYARPRVGAWLALVPAALLLFLGAAWEDVMWPFQVGFIGSVCAGLAMLLALDARRDGPACLALLASVTSSGIGIPFLVVAVVELAFDPRRLRRAWVVAVPVAALAVIELGFKTGGGSGVSSASHTIRWALEMAAAGFGAFGGVGINWGRSLLIVGAVVLIALARRRPAPDVRFVALGCGALAFWLLTAAGRADFGGSAPDTSRYLYPSAALLLALFVTALPRPVLGRGTAIVVAGVTALACVSGAGLMKEGAATRLENTRVLLPRLTALEVARGHTSPGLQIDAFISPDITAASYYSAIDAFGSPALTIPELRAAPDDRRQVFDSALLLALAIKLAPGAAPQAGAPPAVELAAKGRVTTAGSCVAFRPAAAGAALDLTLPVGAYTLSAATALPVYLRRLAGTYGAAALHLAPGAPATLTLPHDRLVDPWHLRVLPSRGVTVCASA